MTGNDDSVIRIGSDKASLALGEAAVGEDGSGSIRLSLRAGHLSADATADLQIAVSVSSHAGWRGLDRGACRWLWVLSPEPSAASRHASGQCLADDPRGTHVACDSARRKLDAPERTLAASASQVTRG